VVIIGSALLAGPLGGAIAAEPRQAASVPALLDIDARVRCEFDTSVLPEVSGITSSRRHPGVVWATNDSLNGAFLYAVDTSDCRIRATLRLLDTPARDHEALAAGVDAQGRDVIWIGDIGNNYAEWPYVRIQKVVEPKELVDADVPVTTYRFTYPGGPTNAEALIAAQDREQLWVVTKVGGDGGDVFELPSPMSTAKEPMIAQRVGWARSYITDAAMAPDGQHYVQRDYFSAEVFSGEPKGESQARFRLPFQLGGESVTWTPDGRSLLVAAEGSGDLIEVEIPRVALGEDSGLAPRFPRVAGFHVYPYVRLAVIATTGLVILVALVRRRSRRRREPDRRARAGRVRAT
jgi:hypothetical protein